MTNQAEVGQGVFGKPIALAQAYPRLKALPVNKAPETWTPPPSCRLVHSREIS
jgi:hypothetical protein